MAKITFLKKNMKKYNTMNTLTLEIIGRIQTPHHNIENMPIQPVGAKGIEGVVDLNPKFELGLTDIEGFSHIILFYRFHQIKGFELMVKPFMDDKQHGIFATRSPKRPNAMGFSIVKLLKVEQNKIFFEGADMLNDTPLLDIKPFFRQTDNRPEAMSGWLDEKQSDLAKNQKSDKRFK